MTRYFLFFLLLSVNALSCDKESADPACELEFPAGTRYFEFLHTSNGDTFVTWTSNTGAIQQVEAQLALPQEQRGQHINGRIDRLPAGCDLNGQWSWYFVPDEWTLADISIELCDGNPRYVEENLDEYIRIGGYCPWGSIVLREVNGPQ